MPDPFETTLRELYRRAATDRELRKRLVSDPRAALRAELGIDIPPEIEIDVVEESADRMVLVLPHLPEGAELDDTELDAAAGGLWSLSSFSTRLRSGSGYAISIP
jgi:hypothetical protein